MENNEFFSMLLNFDNSFQSVPDILRTSNNVQTPDVILNRTTPIKQNNQYNEYQQSYPLDMQFPNALRTPEKQETKEELTAPSSQKTPKVKASGSKKRKQSPNAGELEQNLKVSKLSHSQTVLNSSLDDYDDLDNNSDQDESSKRQRRLVKNREAAQMFRQRQKAYIQNLEKKVNDLNFENQQHRSKVELLTTENRLLADQLNYLRTFISSIVSMNFPGHQQNIATLPSFDPSRAHFAAAPPSIHNMPKDKN